MDIGIDVGGTNLRAGVVDPKGEIRASVRVPVGTLESPEELVARLAGLARTAMQQAGVMEGDIASVGVGIPGAVAHGSILYTCNLPLRGVPFEALFRRDLDLPVYLANDADCAAVGEWRFGAGRGLRDFVTVTLGTGLGGGMILNGRLYTGGGMAGEIGHMVIRQGGTLCGCGQRGCWEAYCSATGLIRQTRETMELHPESLLHVLAAEAGTVDGSVAFLAAEQGDPAALDLCRRYADQLAVGLTSLMNILHPQGIALGGGVSGAPASLLLEPVRALVAARCYARHIGQTPRIVTAELGGNAGLIGAAALRTVFEEDP